MKHSVISPAVSALLKGRQAVEDNWCKGFGQGGQVCAVDALLVGAPSEGHGYGRAMSLLMAALPPGCISVIHYNDDQATTKADILALYTRAIKLGLEAQG